MKLGVLVIRKIASLFFHSHGVRRLAVLDPKGKPAVMEPLRGF